MKKVLIVILCLLVLTTVLGAINEIESNNTPETATVIPNINEYTAYAVGDFADLSDVDWYRFSVNVGNQINVNFFTYTDNHVRVNLYRADHTTIVNSIGVVGLIDTITVDNTYYLKVWYNGAGPMIGTASYAILIHNLTDPTLPVTLSSFTAQMQGTFVGLRWVTESENNLVGYNIFRATDNNIQSASKVNGNMVTSNNSTSTQVYTWMDQNIAPNTTYYYWLESRDLGGANTFHGPISFHVNANTGGSNTPNIDVITSFEGAYPNPFQPSTTLRFSLSKEMPVKLEIFNVKGEKVATVVNSALSKGTHQYGWDGTNNSGKHLKSGIYLGRLMTQEGIFTQKLVLVK